VGRFWSYYTWVNRGPSLQEKTLADAASAVGISEADINACVRDEEAQSRVWSDMFRAAALNVTATPTVVVNGIMVASQLSTGTLLSFIRTQAHAARTPQAR
jgi:predicted DsbA family dithiol-disulfide isomerase